MRRMNLVRWVALMFVVLLSGVGAGIGVAHAAAPKPEKLPILFGAWTGPGIGSFKSAVRQATQKDCAVVNKKLARVIIEGTLTPAATGKGVSVKVVVKSAKNGEVVESHTFDFPNPRADRARGAKIGKFVIDTTRRAPTE